jgi:hypothetical protein
MTQEQKAKDTMFMNGGNSEADKAWFDYCFEYKDGPYTAISVFRQALIKRVKQNSLEGYNSDEEQFSVNEIIQLIKETGPIKQ